MARVIVCFLILCVQPLRPVATERAARVQTTVVSHSFIYISCHPERSEAKSRDLHFLFGRRSTQLTSSTNF